MPGTVLLPHPTSSSESTATSSFPVAALTPFSLPCLCAHRESPGHSVSAALPFHVHHPAVQPVFHTPNHPVPPPSWAGLAQGVCAVCVL